MRVDRKKTERNKKNRKNKPKKTGQMNQNAVRGRDHFQIC